MSDSTREAALKALNDVLSGISGVTVVRNDMTHKTLSAGGLLVLLDGDPGDPDVLLSPARYEFQHRAVVEVHVLSQTASGRDTAMDGILQAIGQAIATDETLSGAVDRATPGRVEIVAGPNDESDIKSVQMDVVLEYVAATPLG